MSTLPLPSLLDLSRPALGTLLRNVASFLNLQLPDVTGAARPLLTHMQLIGAGKRRTRRPTEDELQGLLQETRAQR